MKPASLPCRRLVVVHYHLRPGGVRRVLELALPAVVAARCEELKEVVIAVGEANEAAWIDGLRRSLAGVVLEVRVEPAFRYFSEQRGSPVEIRRRVAAALRRLRVDDSGTVVWAHNFGLGRNLLLADEVGARAGRLVSQHHDFWFDHRWERWPEMLACGFTTPGSVAKVVFGPGVHAVINGADETILRRGLPGKVAWLPNPIVRGAPVPRTRVTAARRWLRRTLGEDGPVWIYPARFLRRKNFAEAVLLTRWLRPEAWLVTTAGVSSGGEREYATRLEAAARVSGWRVKFRVLDGTAGPEVGDLVAAAEIVLMTSVLEGFGLPLVEAAAAGRPLIARRLPNVVPDLERVGFQFPQLYEDVWIAPELFDLAAERKRQRDLWAGWKAALPAGVTAPRRPELGAGPVGFSGLTLTAQLEVLAVPPAESWRLCAPLNPEIASWPGSLRVADWPARADAELGGAAHAERFWAAAGEVSEPVTARKAEAAQRAFIKERLGGAGNFPILLGDA